MKHLFVANWKMRMTTKDAINYCHDNNASMNQLSNNHTIVICPSFTALLPIAKQLPKNTFALGAQDCSAFEPGSYTGQVSARDIAEIGCTYCIIGHNERRMYCGETNEIVAEKAKRLLEKSVRPIICIGETSAECIVETTYQTLEKQLTPLFATLNNYKKTNTKIIIAYEPVWAIGTGIVPTHNYLAAIFTWLHKQAIEQLPNYNVIFIYGGSVDEKTIIQLRNIKHINGFLIGGASTDFKQFKSIIEACDTIL